MENTQIQVIELNKLIKQQAELINKQQKRIAELEETFAQNESLIQRLEVIERQLQQHQFSIAKEVQ